MEPLESKESSAPLRDLIVTLPPATIWVLLTGTLGIIAGAGATLLQVHADELRSAAASTIVVMLPVLIALVAAIGVRRTSTRHIDRLVDGFLYRTVPERFALWCSAPAAARQYPFGRHESLSKPEGRSYAQYLFHWHAGTPRMPPPALVSVKMNVYNFEIVAEAELGLPGDGPEPLALTSQVLTRDTLAAAGSHPLQRAFFSTLQGAIEEGYAVRLSYGRLRPLPGGGRVLHMSVSLRQKLSTSFLTSPFLKRYFAEDAAIAVGVLYNDLYGRNLLASAADVAAAAPAPAQSWLASPR